jgi:hypothetical protein
MSRATPKVTARWSTMRRIAAAEARLQRQQERRAEAARKGYRGPLTRAEAAAVARVQMCSELAAMASQS